MYKKTYFIALMFCTFGLRSDRVQRIPQLQLFALLSTEAHRMVRSLDLIYHALGKSPT